MPNKKPPGKLGRSSVSGAGGGGGRCGGAGLNTKGNTTGLPTASGAGGGSGGGVGSRLGAERKITIPRRRLRRLRLRRLESLPLCRRTTCLQPSPTAGVDSTRRRGALEPSSRVPSSLSLRQGGLRRCLRHGAFESSSLSDLPPTAGETDLPPTAGVNCATASANVATARLFHSGGQTPDWRAPLAPWQRSPDVPPSRTRHLTRGAMLQPP